MHTVDFSQAPGEAIEAVNGWVSGHTHGKIRELLGPQDVDTLTRLVLVNAVYLRARWLLPFAKAATSPAPVLLADRSHHRDHASGSWTCSTAPSGAEI
jgi:serine protease inhibitor